jgi:hypothetical protein
LSPFSSFRRNFVRTSLDTDIFQKVKFFAKSEAFFQKSLLDRFGGAESGDLIIAEVIFNEPKTDNVLSFVFSDV